jgi:aldehyde:ferredoxin oxidoreductase
VNLTVDDVAVIGKQIIDTELEFNRKAGFTSLDDRLPEFMREEKLPPFDGVFDVTDDELDSVF